MKTTAPLRTEKRTRRALKPEGVCLRKGLRNLIALSLPFCYDIGMKFAYQSKVVPLFFLPAGLFLYPSPGKGGEIRVQVRLEGVTFYHPEGVTGKAALLLWEDRGHGEGQGIAFATTQKQRRMEGEVQGLKSNDLEKGPYSFWGARGTLLDDPYGSVEVSRGTMHREGKRVELTGKVRLRHPRGEMEGEGGEVLLKEERLRLEKVKGVIRR